MEFALAGLHAHHAASDLNLIEWILLSIADLLLIILALKFQSTVEISSTALRHGIELHVLLEQAWACLLSDSYTASIILTLSLHASLVLIGVVEGCRRAMNLHLLHALPLWRLLHHMRGLDFGRDFP